MRILILSFFIVGLMVLTLTFAGQKSKFFGSTPVSAAEIIKRNIDLVLKANSIYHQRASLYDEAYPTQPVAIYEVWDDQETPIFLNHVIYPEHPRRPQASELWQWFDRDTQFEADPIQKTLKKEIYIYNRPGEREEKKGERLDLQKKYDELLRQGELTAEETTLDGRSVYLVRDHGDDKSFEALYFDKETFRLLRTESMANAGSDIGQKSFIVYEVQEALPRNEENLQRLQTLPIDLTGFQTLIRHFDTAQGYLEDNYQPQTTPSAEVNSTAAQISPEKWRDAQRRGHLRLLQTALELYLFDHLNYPQLLVDFLSATPSAYLVSIPFDPLTNLPYEYKPQRQNSDYQLCARFETEAYGPKGPTCFSRPQ